MVTVKFFAGFREKAGKGEIELDVMEKTSLTKIVEILEKRIPDLGKLAEEGSAIIAVNREVADLDSIIKNEDEIAIFPPVSGG